MVKHCSFFDAGWCYSKDIDEPNGCIGFNECVKHHGRCSPVDLLLAAVLLNRLEPLAPHHADAIREHLRDLTDDELMKIVQTGRWHNAEAHGRGCGVYNAEK